MDLNDFYRLLGETIDYCQRIEHDIKLIYAAAKEGSFVENLENLKRDKLTLGQVVTELEYLDRYELFSKDDYKLLYSITANRNHFCHQCFDNFLYEQNPTEKEYKFSKEWDRLVEFYNLMSSLWEVVQNVRVRVVGYYRGI